MSAVKPPGKRINRITRNIGVVSAAGKAPRMPKGLHPLAQDAWRAFWTDVASGAMRPPDTIVALRWVADLDRYLSLIAAADAEPLVSGSQGQRRANPLYAVAFKVQAAVDDAERRMGISPLHRLRLGLVLTETAKSLSELNREAMSNAADPRAALTVVADDSP